VATRKNGEGGKGDAAAPRRGAARRPALPDPSGDAPLHELSRDALSVLLYVVLLPEETRALVKELRLSVPGFRTDALSDVERCDVLADEIRAAPETRAVVIDALRAAFRSPPLAKVGLDGDAIEDLLDVGVSEHGLTLSLWRVLADPDAALRARAVPILERLVEEYYGPREPGAKRQAAPRSAEETREETGEEKEQRRATKLERELAEVRGALEEERRKSEDARRRADEVREKLQAQLKEARAREAHAVDESARAREAAGDAARARERAEAALAAAQATDAAAEAQRARAAERDATAKIAGLEARLARLAAREEELASALDAARARPEAERAAPAPAESQADEAEEVPASWLMPVYTREFYDSLEGWDRRILRAAFKQAALLAQDHRHPSLRALPLEGLPGYYRVRVATDVRLLYRRTERQNTVEILSLIDREDLDRYIKQAKSR
jgi:mRNA-degrading endonuclease RelE of RelBE toxin-antitoxin system